MDALIGHTGFVGANLKRQRHFGAQYRSSDIAAIEGRTFDRVVCAGVTAVKWWANQNPAEDRQGIERLMRHLQHVQARHFVLISTVDVYASPLGVTEADAPTLDGLHPYGLHRAMLEAFVAHRFPRHTIIRLPALFGPGLKKNAIYDLMHDNRLDAIPPEGRFQWYPLDRLADDLDTAADDPATTFNFATQPVSMHAIQQQFFPNKPIGAAAPGAPLYDMRTSHAPLFGGTAPYMMDHAAVMASLARFLAAPP